MDYLAEISGTFPLELLKIIESYLLPGVQTIDVTKKYRCGSYILKQLKEYTMVWLASTGKYVRGFFNLYVRDHHLITLTANSIIVYLDGEISWSRQIDTTAQGIGVVNGGIIALHSDTMVDIHRDILDGPNPFPSIMHRHAQADELLLILENGPLFRKLDCKKHARENFRFFFDAKYFGDWKYVFVIFDRLIYVACVINERIFFETSLVVDYQLPRIASVIDCNLTVDGQKQYVDIGALP
jgi:hypothetical protein